MAGIKVLRLLPNNFLTNAGNDDEAEVKSIQPTEHSEDKRTSEQKAQVKALPDEYADGFSDLLTKEIFLRFDPMNIFLREDAISLYTTNNWKPIKNYEPCL
jgi:hypothetical protein